MHGTAAGNPVPLTTFGGLTALAGPESLPEGASPRCYDNDYIVGATYTRDGLTSVYSYPGSFVGPNAPGAAVSSSWTSPSNILAPDGVYTALSILNSGGSSTGGGLGAAGSTTPVTYSPGGLLNVTQFGFNLSNTTGVTGFTVRVTGYADSQTTLTVALVVNGVVRGTPKTQTLPSSSGVMTFGADSDLWGGGFSYADVNNATFGVRFSISSIFGLATTYLDYVSVEVGVATGAANYNYITSFTAQDGSVKNLSLDGNGNLWVEDVTNSPGKPTLALTGIFGSTASAVNGPDVLYMAFGNGTQGADIPRQYTKGWIDRISQVGPGAPPVFTATSAQSTSYPIATITQPAQKTYGYAYFLQSQGPGSISPGNVVTVYYADSTLTGPDTDLVTAFNSGKATYLYTSFTGAPVTQGPYTVAVTSVGLGKPPGQPRQFYYYTYILPTNAYTYYQGSGNSTYTATYQRTLATLTTSSPVPQLSVGSSAVITGDSVVAWNATWPITQTINSGSMSITQTSLDASGNGTYSYNVASGANPVAGQLVTITGTLNADGALNVANATIASVSGTNLGTFTIANLPAGTTWAAQSEQGQATTAGTLFAFEPGLATLGSATSPIYGNGTGGALTISGGGQTIGAGTRQGTVFFITRNGYWTAPAPPVIFTTPNNTTAINASHIPIGPPNVIARGIAFTEAGQLGVPGANFFTIPTDVKYTVNNVTYTSQSLIINDNTTTTANFFFRDAELLSALAIDVQGNNLFNLVEIGNPGWVVQYDSRNFYGLCQNKVQNFNNLSFDGGYNPSLGHISPLGWNIVDSGGTLIKSPSFGNSYYIQNTGTTAPSNLGQMFQSAYQDAYQQPILRANTTYSVRVTARIPSGLAVGTLVLSLDSGKVNYGSWTKYFGSMSTSMATYYGTIVTQKMKTVPKDLQLTIYGANMVPGSDVEIDRIDIYPTDIPVLGTTVFGSYVNKPEAVDSVSGVVQFISENRQPVNGAVVMYDTLYALKESSKYSLRSSPNLEPAQWDEPEVAQKAGACGVYAYDFGEQWIVEACRNGLYLYEGGMPGKIMQEIYQIWESINWQAKSSIWVRNDVKKRRLFIGVPMTTPNFWLPNAPVNTNPTTPNVMLMCNYQGIDTGEGLKVESSIHVTMFGTLEAGDMRRKWSIWQIPSPYGAIAKTQTDEAFYIGNGLGNSKMYVLDPNASTDDGAPISSLYTTYGFVNLSKAAQYPMLGMYRKRWSYLTSTVAGAGTLGIRLLPNTLIGPSDATAGYYPYTVPGGIPLTPVALSDREASLNFPATRTFVEFSGTDFHLSNVTLYGRKDVWNGLTGQR